MSKWWDEPELALVNRKCPILLHSNAWLHLTQLMLQKLNELSTNFCLICHIHLTYHQPTTISSITSTTFFRENASTTSRMQKMLSKSLLNPKAQIFPLQEYQTYFSLAIMYWLWWFLFWVIKMCLSLVIMIQNSQSEAKITFASP